MVIKEIVKGKGAVSVPSISRKPKAEISTMYKVADYKTGRILEDRWAIGNPFVFKFAPGEVVPAWEKGIVGMRVGGRRELVVPSRMAYGSGARVFVVEVLAIKKIDYHGASGSARQAREASQRSQRQQESNAPKQAGTNSHQLTIPKQSGPPPRHIEIIDLRKGTGPKVLKEGSVNVRWLEGTYTEARKKSLRGVYGPQTFGLDNVVKGWDVGLPGMRVGGRRELILPPKLVYPRWRPSWGYTPYVNIYVVELLGVKPS